MPYCRKYSNTKANAIKMNGDTRTNVLLDRELIDRENNARKKYAAKKQEFASVRRGGEMVEADAKHKNAIILSPRPINHRLLKLLSLLLRK
jgi:hypothetical protein